jgi:hypothetical protein
MATYTVGPGGDYTVMSTAIAAATAGDTLQVLAGYSFNTGTEAYDFVKIDKDNLTLESQGGTPSSATIATADSANDHPTISVHQATTGISIKNLTIKNTGAGTMPFGINCGPSANSNVVNIEDCVIESTGMGVGYIFSGSVKRCHIKGTGTLAHVGVHYTGGSSTTSVIVESCLFDSIKKYGVFNMNGGFTVRNCTFYNPTPSSSSAGMYMSGDPYTVSNCVFYTTATTMVPILMSDDSGNTVKNCVAFGSATMVFTGLGGSIVKANLVDNSAAVTPVFVSVGSDFHPDPDGSAYQAGDASLAATTDIDGNSFDTPPSIGCYEAESSGGGGGGGAVASSKAGFLSSPFTLNP